jgi:hypothetical protein
MAVGIMEEALYLRRSLQTVAALIQIVRYGLAMDKSLCCSMPESGSGAGYA